MTQIEPAFRRHDHSACMDEAMAAAEARCAAEGLRLTPVRRRVLEILLAEHKAMGAYEILPRLAEEGLGSQPPVVYRALDFLVGHGFAHRVERPHCRAEGWVAPPKARASASRAWWSRRRASASAARGAGREGRGVRGGPCGTVPGVGAASPARGRRGAVIPGKTR